VGIELYAWINRVFCKHGVQYMSPENRYVNMDYLYFAQELP